MANDNIQHGIDNNPSGDAEKGAALGGVGGLVTGAMAGSVAGPVGMVVGALIGGVAGAAASGAAVAAVDRVDNDNTVSGLGGNTNDGNSMYETDDNGGRYRTDTSGNRIYTDETGAHYHTHITTGERNYVTNPMFGTTSTSRLGTGATGINQLSNESMPSIKTGGYANDGTPDTRGAGEKLVDAVTGDVRDDKTGKVVDHR